MTPPDALATRPTDSQSTHVSVQPNGYGPTRLLEPTEVVEIPVDFHGVAQGADDLPRRFLARHDSPVPTHGDDHPALASYLRRLGADVARQCSESVPLPGNDRLPAA